MEARMELNRLRALANACIGKKNMKVELGKAWAYDGKTIFVAPVKDGNYNLAKGYLNHEVGHARYSNMALLKDPEVRHNALLGDALNIVEDILVENKMCKEFDGARSFMAHAINEWMDDPDHCAAIANAGEWRVKLGYLYLKARGYVCPFGPFEDMDGFVADANNLRRSGRDTTLALAHRIYGHLRDSYVEQLRKEHEERKAAQQNQNEQEQEQEQEQPGAPRYDEGAPQEDEGATKLEEGDEGESGESEEGSGEEGAESEGDEDGSGGGGESEDEPEDEGEGGDPGEFDEEAAKKAFEEAENNYARCGIWDEIQEKIKAMIDKDMVNQMAKEGKEVQWIRPEDRERWFPREYWYSRVRYHNIPEVGEYVRKPTAKLKIILREACQVKKVGGLKAGKIQSKALYRARSGNYHVFAQKKRGMDNNNIAVAIAVDCSGSMHKSGGDGLSKMDHAKITAKTICDMLHDLGINFALYGFTSHSGIGKNYKRELDAPCNISFKEFGEHWLARRDSMKYMAPTRDNWDAHSLFEIYNRLMQQSDKTKILFVISDGRPNPEPPELLRSLVLRMIKSGVKVVGFGLDHAQIAHFYPAYVCCTPDKLSVQMVHVMRQLMLHDIKGETIKVVG